MKFHTRHLILIVVGLLLSQQAAFAQQPSLEEYSARIQTFRDQIPAIVASADRYAANMVEHPRALLNFPWEGQQAFGEEFMSRAGGIEHAKSSHIRKEFITEHDMVLYTVRSWETHEKVTREQLAICREQGWPITLIASKAGMPEDIKVDFFIDNGAPSGGAEHGRVNILANVTLGWMWAAEYTAGMTRRGKMPGILMSVSHDEAIEFNKQFGLKEDQRLMIDCDTPIAERELAELYLKRVEKLVADLHGEQTQAQIAKAADVIAAHMNKGGTVGLSGVGHLIPHEMFPDNRSPFKPLRSAPRRDVPNPFKDALEPGDLLLFIAYIGMNSRWHDYLTPIKEAEVKLITCYVTSKDPAANAPDALAHVEQQWELGDAEVPLPCEPHRMAPVSGINSGLLQRMIDDAVYERLTLKDAE